MELPPSVNLFAWSSPNDFVVVAPAIAVACADEGTTAAPSPSFLQIAHGSIHDHCVADGTFSPELRKLLHGCVEEFESLQQRCRRLTKQRASSSASSQSASQPAAAAAAAQASQAAVLAEVSRSSDAYLALLDRCLEETRLNADAQLQQQQQQQWAHTTSNGNTPFNHGQSQPSHANSSNGGGDPFASLTGLGRR
mmetsp:Transcript_62680/g.123146  ORF Transcript_62680/g.123146 Transcript_62680/m.123146 type:complete len:195 (+) Transcript_62680:38-622(+)